jgi:hypothetical protein
MRVIVESGCFFNFLWRVWAAATPPYPAPSTIILLLNVFTSFNIFRYVKSNNFLKNITHNQFYQDKIDNFTYFIKKIMSYFFHTLIIA